MPAKPKSIADAEKRTIKTEITALKKERRRSLTAYDQSSKKTKKEIHRLEVSHGRIARQAVRQIDQIDRRISILEGRL